MKKILVLFILTCLVLPLAADEKIEDKDIKEINLNTEALEGRAKAGIAFGYPTGLVFGYRLANYLEVNALAGSFFNGFTLGGNMLFTVADIKIKGESFPLSIGPHLNVHFGSVFDMALLGLIRWEYTFKEIPLNLYLEGGPGFTFIQGFDLSWSTSLGVRYVF